VENVVAYLLAGVGLIAVVVVIALVYETGRSVYFWAAAKIYGWSEREKFKRETARFQREFERDQRQAAKDDKASRDTDRQRFGVFLVTAAVASLAWHMNLPWWHVGLIAAAVYVGLTMAAGLAWKWW
jgi:Flp pilus assembly protein TadB